MTDYLKPLPANEVAAWYYRLAASIAKNKIQGTEPLASMFLKQWLNNRNKKTIFKFNAPSYLKQSKSIIEVQDYHHDVFLTVKKARVGKLKKWAGVIPRLQGINGYTKWQGAGILSMEYQSLCDIAPTLIEIIRIKNSGNEAERDLLTSLRGFQLKSKITLRGKKLPDNLIQLNFVSWNCKVMDTYDWKYSEHFTVPNPDFGSKKQNAVRPGDRSLKVYHKNAKRLEDAKLAAPYIIESNIWQVVNGKLLAAVNVDPNKALK